MRVAKMTLHNSEPKKETSVVESVLKAAIKSPNKVKPRQQAIEHARFYFSLYKQKKLNEQ